ncbi:MAG: FecR domain-containing protein, partial [Clostridium sp.]|nr:FecR domain-containing protein [Clostridium sp.]
MKRIKVFLILFCLLLSALSTRALADNASASTIRLSKTEGTVNVKDAAGKDVFRQADMRLVSGNRTLTSERSYAWFALDDVKALKEDAVSETEVRQNGKKLEVLLHSGNLFFNVREPLTDQETMNIRTSTMVMGIRGTSGWVKIMDSRTTRVFMLDGVALCSVTNPITGQTKSILLRAGETADFVVYDPNRPVDQCDILLRRFTKEEIDGFVLMELLGDDPTILKILQDSGIDLRNLTEQEARARLLEDQKALNLIMSVVNSALANQASHISQDPVWDRQPVPEEEEAAPVPTPEGPVRILTMPVTAQEVQDLLDDPAVTQVILQPGGGDNTLNIGIPFTVPEGKTLTTNAGVPVDVNDGYSMD